MQCIKESWRAQIKSGKLYTIYGVFGAQEVDIFFFE